MFKTRPAHGRDSVHACREYYPVSGNGLNKGKQMEMDGLLGVGEQTSLSGAESFGLWFSNYGAKA